MESIHIVLDVDATTTRFDGIVDAQEAILETLHSAMTHPGDVPSNDCLAKVVRISIQLNAHLREERNKERNKEKEGNDEKSE